MAEGIGTLTPAKVWFKNLGENMLDVVRFTIEEQMSSLFRVQVTAGTSDGTIDLSTLIGKGAALRFSHHSGDVVWAGICAEAGQVRNQPQGAAKASVYRFVIAPALYRTTLRRNNRVFERKSIKEIVATILAEWEIPFNMDGLKETYRTQDHRVQYNETDFAFLSRLLEEAGISYYFDSTVKSGLGSSVTSVVFADAPQTALTGSFPYLETGRHKKFADAERPIWDVSIAQHMTFGKTTIADYEFRQVLGSKLYEEAKVPPPDADTQLDYEDYQYIPNAFSAVEDGSEDAVADDKGKVRPVEGEAKDRTRRELGLLRHAQLRVEFSSSAVDLAPGHVFAIGQKSAHHHPNPEVSPERKLLVTGRQIIGDTRGADHARLSAVPGDFPHRPQRRTPRPRILGLQSALVVGPVQQEIHADEYGRVRVQFHWDREGVYDDESSCWMRVSQGWAGSSYGMITLPRVGHEVLVAFHEGDPDSPVIVGALFNNTNKIPFKLPENKTRSVWRTESSGGMQSDSPRGFNELAFEDAHGKEAISLRAERNLSTLVKSSETSNIGKARNTRIGTADSVQIGPPGKDVQVYQHFVGQTTGFQMRSDGEVVLSTTKASIAMKGEDLAIEASEVGLFRAGKKMHVSAGPGAIVFLWGGPQVQINPSDAGDINPSPVPLGKAAAPQRGQPMGPPFYPSGGPVSPQPPGAFLEVKVKNPPPRGGSDGSGR